MSIKNTHISIPKDIATKNDMDYQFLKEKGIEYIEKMGSNLWTDYNEHDPGVTILEMLSYAITDLGMRINQPIKNLLSSQETLKNINHQFYKASDIFPIKPVTALDYRKLFIDIDGVKNAWIKSYDDRNVYVNCKQDIISYNESVLDGLQYPQDKKRFVLKGLYSILIDFDESDTPKQDIIKKVKTAYHQNRNLGEDLVEIVSIEEQPIKVCSEIEVAPNADEEYIAAQIKFAINQFFSPSVRFYSVSEMLEKGYTTDQIFEGPLLNKGFIDTKELSKAEIKTEIRLSDLVNIIMDIEGVKVINNISINQYELFEKGACKNLIKQDNKWNVCITGNKKPRLCSDSTFNFKKGVLPLNINQSKVDLYYQQLIDEDKESQLIADKDKKLKIPNGQAGTYNTYNTIQNDFPETYGIGLNGLSQATSERKAQVKQLKAYLLFFDQILASYFKHLGKIKEVLSVNPSESKTLFTQSIRDIKGFDDLVKDYPQNDDDALAEILFNDLDNNIHKRNQILDHLIARFAEKFGEYTFIMKTIYGDSSDEIVLNNKEDFLRDYVSISSKRGAAFNYYNQEPSNLWDTDNISGVQKRIARLMGVKNSDRRDLFNSYVEIYNLEKPQDKPKYRWRIRNKNKEIILSASTNYQHVYRAKKELDFTLIQILNSDTKEIARIFDEETIEDEKVIENFLIQQAESGSFSIDVIDRTKNKNDIDYIIARQYIYYKNVVELEKGLFELIYFFKNIYTEEEGMFLVEHILLRPDVNKNQKRNEIAYLPICKESCKNTCDIDPYSFKVTIVLPGFTQRFSNPDFRKYMEQIIREEIPAHIVPKICWIGDLKSVVPDKENDLLNFEKSYQKYLLSKTHKEQDQPKNELKNLIASIEKLNTIYPTANLLDCEDESDEQEGKIILGQTGLGTLRINITKSDNDTI